MPNQSLGRRRLLQIKLFFCLFHHFNSPQCEIWTRQQMASVLCLAAGGGGGGGKCPRCARAWKTRDAPDMFIRPLFSRARARPLAGTHHAGQESDRRPRPRGRRHTFHQNAMDDLAWSLRWPHKVALYTKKSSGYQQIEKKQESLKMITAFFSDFISSLLCEQ